jgi:vWA-MoxR associated protein C-terminal domain/vWA-MoxR associated protein middle region 0
LLSALGGLQDVLDDAALRMLARELERETGRGPAPGATDTGTPADALARLCLAEPAATWTLLGLLDDFLGETPATAHLRAVVAGIVPPPLLENRERAALRGLLADLPVRDWGPLYMWAADSLAGPPPRDLWRAAADLEERVTPPDGVPRLLTFAAALAELAPGPQGARLREWADHVADRLGARRPGTAPDAMSRRDSGRQLYLIVELSPSGLSPARFHMVAWIVHSSSSRWRTLVVENEARTVPELREPLDRALDEARRYLFDGEPEPLFVEFLLPSRLLGLEVDQWIVTSESGLPEPLGELYPVVVRDADRLRRPGGEQRWHERWRSLQRVAGRPAPEAVAWLRGMDREAAVRALLADRRAPVCVALDPAPGPQQPPDTVRVAVTAGMPVVVWHRGGPDRLEEEIRPLFDRHELGRLPMLALGLRRGLDGTAAPDRDIALLWDDPDRIPETLTFRLPY